MLHPLVYVAGRRLLQLAAILGIAALFAGSARAVTSTWNGTTGLWSDPTRWSTNPNYPCNGQGGASYDVILGSGTVTLDVPCDIVSLNHSGGTFDGVSDLTISNGYDWTGGTHGGSGTTTVNGGLDVSTGLTKSLSGTRTLVQAGLVAGSWSAGAISMSSGSTPTLINQAQWNITGPTRSLTDSADGGSFLNSAIGRVDVDLQDANQTLTLSPGTLQNAGVLSANVGIVSLNGSGTHTGDFIGAGTIRFSGGTHLLEDAPSVAVVSVADLEVTGSGTLLSVGSGVSFAPAHVDIAGGTLEVVDPLDTVVVPTATLGSGTLGGAGTFETSGAFAWDGGTQSGSGTTRAEGGLQIGSGLTKIVTGTRTIVNAGGIGSWSGGAISMGAGSTPTLINQAQWNITGPTRSLTDSANGGSFLNSASGSVELALDSAASTITIATGTATNAGQLTLTTGRLVFSDSFVQTAGATRLAGGVLDGPPLLDFQGGRLEGGGDVLGNVAMGGTLAPGLSAGPAAGQLDVAGTLALAPGSTFEVELLGATRGSEYDSVTATGAVTLGGTLAVDVDDAFRASVPVTPFVLLERIGGSALSGSFANVASGQRVFTPDLDSFVVRYGVGSPAGADRVVLEDFVRFEIVSSLGVNGIAAGGTISLDISGVPVDVVLTPGMTPAQVAAAIAAAVNANATLRQLGIAGLSSGGVFQTNGVIENASSTDPGITLGGPPPVPALGAPAAGLLGLLLTALGLGSSRGAASEPARRNAR